jgi:hypothetical protein
MTRFLALYSGPSIHSAELIAVSADERIVHDFGRRLITDPREPEDDELDHPPSVNGNGHSRRPTRST